MMPTRQDVVSEAKSWLRTPYLKAARIKGVGCDCATLPFMIYQNCGLVPKGEEGIFDDERVVPLSDDWFCHTNEERYMRLVLRYAHRVAEAVCLPCLKIQPGNVVLTRAVGARVYNHGGIVIEWPRIIHAIDPFVCEADALSDRLWERQIVTALDPWEKMAERGIC